MTNCAAENEDINSEDNTSSAQEGQGDNHLTVMEDRMRATYNKDTKPIDPDNIKLDLTSEDGDNEPVLVKKENSGEENNQNGHN